MLTGSDHLVVLYVPRDGTQDDLLHNLPWYQGQTDRPQILLVAVLVGGHQTEHYHACSGKHWAAFFMYSSLVHGCSIPGNIQVRWDGALSHAIWLKMSLLTAGGGLD